MAEHELKTDPAAFDDVACGAKTHEIRFNDRNYAVGDVLVLRRTKNTGRAMSVGIPLEFSDVPPLRRVVTHIQTGYGLGPGWIIMSIRSEGAPLLPPLSAEQVIDLRSRYGWAKETIRSIERAIRATVPTPGVDHSTVANAARYAFVRLLGPSDFLELWREQMRTGTPIDKLVDAAIVAEHILSSEPITTP